MKRDADAPEVTAQQGAQRPRQETTAMQVDAVGKMFTVNQIPGVGTTVISESPDASVDATKYNVVELALAHLGSTFRLKCNGRHVLHTAPVSALQQFAELRWVSGRMLVPDGPVGSSE